MENTTLVALLLLLVSFSFIIIDFVPNSYAHPVECLASDREALIDFKNGLQDFGNGFSSWKGRNCCRWHGIRCENITSGAVVAVNLRGSDYISGRRFNLSGEIRPSLMKLKSLRHLDLSSNSFNDIAIPEFFGSLENLQYLNLSSAGFGGKIPPNLRNLSHLKSLDLSFTDVEDVKNLQWLSGLFSLEYLSLDGIDLSLVGTDWVSAINQFSSLTELHLSNCDLVGEIPSLTSPNFTSLSLVDLSLNNFWSRIPDWLVNITSLEHIDMSNSYIFGRIPLGFGDLPNLLSLRLYGNLLLTASCSQLFRRRWEKIQVLELSTNKIHGKLPYSLGNMTTLVYLDLTFNAVGGEIPVSIGKLCNLNVLILSENNITNLPKYLEGPHQCPSKKPLLHLEQLHLSRNQLIGEIPDWLHQLENLVQLSLDYNLLEGSLPITLGLLRNLEWLVLGRNKLNGTLPESIGQLSELSVLDVSHNLLTGMVSEAHFSKLSKLEYLDFTSNSFTVNVSSNWVLPFQAKNIHMSSCVLGPLFPSWLKSQNEVTNLDFSNTSISGYIPNWFWDMSSKLSHLNISHNDLQGDLPNPIPVAPRASVDLSFNNFEGSLFLPTAGINFLDLSHNRFSGPIPGNIGHVTPGLFFLSFSYNQLQGEMPLSLEEMSDLIVLDLSNNNLTGRIPPNLGNCSGLNVLDLSSNNLVGTILDSLVQLQELRSLHLSGNDFWGNLPSSFRNLSNLETIDFGNNRFSGIIPPWLGDGFAHLRILSFRSNAFSGVLPPELAKLSSLQVLDLARNNLAGSIPSTFGNLKAIVEEQKNNIYLQYGTPRDGYYVESYVVNAKGQLLKYTKTLSLVTSIDLSDNNFTGNIPHEITKLSGLVVLNLSRNHLTGRIPEGIANLHQLQSLDLSSNRLSGAIPSSLSALSFLGYLNLSNNYFLGAIPYAGHMTTFEESCFSGNPGLCGPPLHVKCPGDDDPSHESDKEQSNKNENDDGLVDKWFYLSLGLGFAAGILIPYFIFAIKRSWCGAYFAVADVIIYKFSRLFRHRN